MVSFTRRMEVKLLWACGMLLAAVCLVVGRFVPEAGGQPETGSRSTVLTLALLPGGEGPGGEDERARERVKASLSEWIAQGSGEIAYSAVEVTSFREPDEAEEALDRARFTLIECDPAAYFQAKRESRRMEWPYKVMLQRTSEPQQRGGLIVARGRPVQVMEELRGRWVMIPDPHSGLSLMGLSLLDEAGLSAGDAFQLYYYGTVPNGIALLKLGVADAAVLPRAVVESDESLKCLAVTDPYPLPLFAVRRSDLESNPVGVHRALQSIREILGFENVVEVRETYYGPFVERLWGNETGTF